MRLPLFIEEVGNIIISLINDKLDLYIFFDKLYEHYSLILKERGLLGVWQGRRAILDTIRSLNFGMFNKRTKALMESEIKESLHHITVYKYILTSIKYTVGPTN
jgi:hypothetical protein